MIVDDEFYSDLLSKKDKTMENKYEIIELYEYYTIETFCNNFIRKCLFYSDKLVDHKTANNAHFRKCKAISVNGEKYLLLSDKPIITKQEEDIQRQNLKEKVSKILSEDEQKILDILLEKGEKQIIKDRLVSLGIKIYEE